MHHAIIFRTSKFEVSKERENPINPIFGHSLLDWLREKLKNEVQITKPEAEDWGWYSYLEWQGRKYLIGASVHYGEHDDSSSELEWVFQIDKQRSIIEKLSGKEKMGINDPCLLFFKRVFESELDIKGMEVE